MESPPAVRMQIATHAPVRGAIGGGDRHRGTDRIATHAPVRGAMLCRISAIPPCDDCNPRSCARSDSPAPTAGPLSGLLQPTLLYSGPRNLDTAARRNKIDYAHEKELFTIVQG